MSEPEIDFLREEVADQVLPEAPAPEAQPEMVVQQPDIPAAEGTTPTAPKEEDRVPLAALMAEREKRQKEAQQREQLEKRLRELEAQQKQLPNFYEAPEEYITQLSQQLKQDANQRLFSALEEQAREAYSDYDEVIAVVQEHAATNPAIVQDVFSKANPALAAYKLGKQLREYKAMQDPVAYRESIKAEVLAELKKSEEAKEEARRKAAEAIPPNLADARAAKDAEVVPDDSLESILKSKR